MCWLKLPRSSGVKNVKMSMKTSMLYFWDPKITNGTPFLIYIYIERERETERTKNSHSPAKHPTYDFVS